MAANGILCVGRLRGSLCLQPSFTGEQKPCTFHSHILFRFFSRFWCCRLGSPAWDLECTLLKGNPPATEKSLQNFNYPPVGAQPPLSCLLCNPYQLHFCEVVSVVCPCLKGFFLAGVQLVSRIISLQFGCKLSLVLGGILCSFYFVLHHLASLPVESLLK